MNPRERRVHWKHEVQRLTELIDISRTSTPMPTTTPGETTMIASRSSRDFVPPTPEIPNIPLPSVSAPPSPPAGCIHPMLAPLTCPEVDFSFPSHRFGKEIRSQFDSTIMQAPAYKHGMGVVMVLVDYPPFKPFDIEIVNEAGTVTVGDVMHRINAILRAGLAQTIHTEDMKSYSERRVKTVSIGERLSHEAVAQAQTHEEKMGIRVCDALLGHTCFRGLALRPEESKGDKWRLFLGVPERYRRLEKIQK